MPNRTRKTYIASVKHTAIIDADPQTIWHVLRKFDSIAEWHTDVAHCTVEDGKSADTGCSIRKLTLAVGDLCVRGFCPSITS